jgi:hypothetical protein
MTARRGSFGGGAATWMRKRQTKEAAEPVDRSLTEKESANTNAEAGLQVPASKTAKGSMVWDEERCRIVYEPSVPVSNKHNNAIASATEEEEEDEDDDNVSVDDAASYCWETSYDLEEESEQAAVPRVSMEKPTDLSFPMPEELNVVAVVSTNTTTGKGRRGGKRSYASRKRMPLQSPPLNDAVLDVQAHHSRRSSKRIKRKLVDTEDGTILHTTHTLSQESVSQEEEEEDLAGETVSIEASQEEAKAPPSSPVQLEPSSMFDFDDTEEKAEKHKATSRRPKRASTQPSSKTSLEKAQCYFEQLDAKERLTLDNSKTPPSAAAGKACIRTRRHHVVAPVLDPTVLGEYKDYVTACQESGVAPRPVQSSFFRTNVIHDGFFDE